MITLVKKILDEKLISIPEVKEILDSVFERMEKLGDIKPDPFQDATYEYVQHFAKMDGATARKITKMLVSEYNMDASMAIQIVNIDPQWPQEVKVILEKDQTLNSMSNEDLTIMIQQIRDLQ